MMEELRGRLRARVDRGVGVAVWELKTIVAEHPRVAMPLARLRGHGELVAADTEVLIEGFVRSGLSFAVAAFKLAQEPNPVVVAHHTHAPAAVIDAVRRRIPAILIVREPEDAILSYLIKTPSVSVRSATRGYIRFHGPLLPYRRGFIVGTFQETTGGHFDRVIHRMNERFGTAFAPFDHTDANVAEVFRRIDADWRNRGRDEDERERGIPRPFGSA